MTWSSSTELISTPDFISFRCGNIYTSVRFSEINLVVTESGQNTVIETATRRITTKEPYNEVVIRINEYIVFPDPTHWEE